MIFVFTEDRGLMVLNDLEEVRKNCEGVDVAQGVYQFYDENCRRLEAEFIRPILRRKLIGPIGFVSAGEFVLKPSKEDLTQQVC